MNIFNAQQINQYKGSLIKEWFLDGDKFVLVEEGSKEGKLYVQL